MAAAKPPKSEKHTAFCYSFTPREMWYFLFGKKIFSRCGGALRKCKGHATLHGEMPHSHDKPIRIDTSRVKYYRYHYTCDACGAVFSLAELAEGRKGRL